MVFMCLKFYYVSIEMLNYGQLEIKESMILASTQFVQQAMLIHQ